jgi:hypothetical protein
MDGLFAAAGLMYRSPSAHLYSALGNIYFRVAKKMMRIMQQQHSQRKPRRK